MKFNRLYKLIIYMRLKETFTPMDNAIIDKGSYEGFMVQAPMWPDAVVDILPSSEVLIKRRDT